MGDDVVDRFSAFGLVEIESFVAKSEICLLEARHWRIFKANQETPHNQKGGGESNGKETKKKRKRNDPNR